jgi:hypothetical protein
MHKLAALKEGSWGQASIRNILDTTRHNTAKFGEHQGDKYIHDWAEKQNVAVVYDNSKDTDLHWNRQDPCVSSPEDLFLNVEEQELLESLPLC